MNLTSDVFTMDCPSVCSRIEAFIAATMQSLHRKGIVVPISGGLDSSVVVSLCVRAVGKEQVTGLLLPEKKGNPDALQFGNLVANQLGIRTVTVDISPILDSIGAYEFISNKVGPRPF